MKKLILILGANAVGKTTTSKGLLQRILKSAYVDSEWCRAINPFPFTEETKKTVTNNIYSMLKNYLCCEDIENVIFSYGFHGERKQIFDEAMNRLREEIDFELYPIILMCSEEENVRRAVNDGRDRERIARGMKNTFSYYDQFTYPKIDTTCLQPDEVVERILEILVA